ncbi:MAG TPA: response regulator, partial [Methanomicrobiales archaeon]|nr:response regulator [Methanomicrobiales archaeon]
MTGGAGRPEKAAKAPGEPAEIRVLLVIGDPDHAEYARNDLQSEGCFRVETARSGEDALERLKGAGFDAVVAGQRLSGMSGLGLLKSIRCGGNKIPFLLLARGADLKTVVEAFNQGASG